MAVIDSYIHDFIIIAIIHLIAVISPGPDFALICRQGLIYGRETSIWTSIGIGCGILVHIFYCIIGIAIIIANSIFLFTAIQVMGALYLFYLGALSIKSSYSKLKVDTSFDREVISSYSAFSMGFLTNILNPKATLFFISLFSIVIQPTTAISIQIFYGLWMSLITGLWFIFLSFFLTTENISKKIDKIGYIIEKVMGLVLIFFSIKILFEL